MQGGVVSDIFCLARNDNIGIVPAFRSQEGALASIVILADVAANAAPSTFASTSTRSADHIQRKYGQSAWTDGLHEEFRQ